MFNNQLNIQQKDRDTKGKKSPEKPKRVYILNYSPEKLIDSKKNKWDLTETKHQKRVDILLKKQSLKEKNPQLVESTSKEVNQRNNIDRFMNIISRSRTFVKANDSGCQKMIRALGKLFNKFYPQNDKKAILHLGLQSLKKYTMTCSSSNYELFLQSRHNILKDTCKIAIPPHKEPKLEQISENVDQQPINSQSSQFPSKSLQEIQSPIDKLVIQKEEVSIDLRKYQTPKKQPIYTTTYLATQDDITFASIKTPKTNKSVLKENKCINLFLSKVCPKTTIIDKSIDYNKFSQQKQQFATKPTQKDFLTQQKKQEYSQEMSLQLKIISQMTTKPVKQSSIKQETNKMLKNSPRLSQMYAFPVQMNQQKQMINTATSIGLQKAQIQPTDNLPQKLIKIKSEQMKQTRKKEWQPIEYAQIMLGENQQKDKKIQQIIQIPKPTVFEEIKRQRISSLPKITFTYSSRQKTAKQVYSPPKINSLTPKTIHQYNNNKFQNKRHNYKNTSQDELQSTFQSKRGRVNSRFNHNMKQINFDSNKMMTIPVFHQRINISPSSRPLMFVDNCNKHVVRTQYYGDFHQMKKIQPQSYPIGRQRIITFQQKNSKQYGTKRPDIRINGGNKETRSISLNQRVLVGVNNVNKAWS